VHCGYDQHCRRDSKWDARTPKRAAGSALTVRHQKNRMYHT
jgi:hypothetical protein